MKAQTSGRGCEDGGREVRETRGAGGARAMTARLSQSAPTRDDDLVKHLPDDLFEDGPSVEEALNAALAPAITMADLEVVRECAGSPGPLRRFVPETSSPTHVLMNTPMHAEEGVGDGGARYGVDDSLSYTLSPQSSLKPERKFGLLEKGTSPSSPIPASATSPPVAVYSYAPSAGSARSMNGNAGKPPRGNSFKSGSVPHARSGSSFGNRAGGGKPVKFTGSAFRSARDEYLEKVFDFLFRERGDGWMTIKSKSGVSGRCRKPVTMPETYLEFFDTHRDKFEISPERTKVRLRETRWSRSESGDSGESDATGIEEISEGIKAL